MRQGEKTKFVLFPRIQSQTKACRFKATTLAKCARNDDACTMIFMYSMTDGSSKLFGTVKCL